MSHHKIHHTKHPKARALVDRNHHLQNRDGWWHFVIEWNGRRIRRACGTTDQALARTLRDQWMEDVWRDGMLPAEVPVSARVTVGQILAQFEAGPMESSPAHRRRVANIVRAILRVKLGDGVEAADQEALSDDSLGVWRRHWLAQAESAAAKDGQAAGARTKATGNSMLNQAAALCSADALQLYRDHGLAVTVGEAWRAACRARGFKVAAARARFLAPPEAVVRALLASVGDLLSAGLVQPPAENGTAPEVQRRNLALAVAVMLGGGLRKGEVSQLRWEWIADRGADWLIDGAAEVKDGGGRLRQRVMGWALDRAKVRELRRADGLVIEGHDTERNEAVFRRVSEWMRALGWEAQKTSHGLRDLAISIVIANTGSAWEGQGFARHASVQVTERHYGHFAREDWLRSVPGPG